MRHTIFLGLAVQAAVAVSTASATTPETATMNVGTAEQQAIYLSGAATALMILNMQLSDEGRYFCPPPEYVLNAREMQGMAASSLQGSHDPMTFVLAVTDTLRSRFPCS